jgi:uncharacterized membrane protein
VGALVTHVAVWHRRDMSFTTYAKLYGIALVVFFALDLLWLGVIAKGLYQKHLGFLMREQVLWPAAILFYVLFLVGLIVFVIGPAMETGSMQKALVLGAFYGFITYQTYELTNWAMVKNWPVQIVVIDIVWGVVLSASVSTLTVLIGKRIL